MVVALGDTLTVNPDYDPAAFDATTVEALGESLRTLLTGMATDPDRRLADLPLLASDAGRALVDRFGGPVAEAPHDTPPEAFRRQAERTPDAPAVRHGDTSLTYRELSTPAPAGWPGCSSPPAPDPSASSRSACPAPPTLVVALLACSRAAPAICRSTPSTRPSASRSLRGRTARRRDHRHGDRRPAAEGPVHPDPAGSGPGRRGAGHPGRRRRTAWPPAAWPPRLRVIHTSGSTGRPGGVVVSHASVLAPDRLGGGRVLPAGAWRTRDRLHLAQLRRVGLRDLLRCLRRPREVVRAPAGPRRAPRPWRAGLLSAVPSAPDRLLAEDAVRITADTVVLVGRGCPPGPCAGRAPSPAARSATSTGPPRPPSTPPRSPATRPTPTATRRSAGSLGGARAYVLDERMRPVPVGAPGELFLRRGPASPAATCAALASTASRFRPTRSARPAAACTAPATWSAGRPTATSSTSAAGTTRSRCGFPHRTRRGGGRAGPPPRPWRR
ncbi:hypothetical protein LT493_15465 [Streptomyces tricolor]|nr:hypothetical protein [Streptomyces tricolor]